MSDILNALSSKYVTASHGLSQSLLYAAKSVGEVVDALYDEVYYL